jgi:hypothetical protein
MRKVIPDLEEVFDGLVPSYGLRPVVGGGTRGAGGGYASGTELKKSGLEDSTGTYAVPPDGTGGLVIALDMKRSSAM